MGISYFLLLLVATCCAISSIHATVSEYEHMTCKREFNKIGCFDEYNAKKGELLVDYRAHVKWMSIADFLHSLACKCADEAKKANLKKTKESEKFVGFALHYYGECYGRTKAHVDELMGRTSQAHRCVGDQSYIKCEEDHSECTGKDFAEYVYEFKVAAPININGGFSDWMGWTSCTPACGEGVRVRERTCTNPEPKGTGKDCENSNLGNSTHVKSCKIKECPVDGIFTSWTKYGACDKACGGGTHTRQRACTDPAPSHGGKNCEGDASEKKACNVHKCPIDGKWSAWSGYGECSAACGGGMQARSRGCTNPRPEHRGAECIGVYMEDKKCNSHACPVHGRYGSWSGYSACTKTCGTGSQKRTRSCDRPAPAHGGANCLIFGAAEEINACNTHPCPVPVSREYTTRTCEHDSRSISCPSPATIMVTFALYGRETKAHCGKWHDLFWSTSCRSSSSLSKVKQYCEGRRSCRVSATNGVFGDPCWGTFKYLEIRYRCRG